MAFHAGKVLILGAAAALAFEAGLSGQAAAQSNEMAVTTPAVGLTPAAEAARAQAQYIYGQLISANAAGLKAVTTDPDFKKSLADLQAYYRAFGTTGLMMLKSGHDPATSLIAAAVAGEVVPFFDSIKKDYKKGLNDKALSELEKKVAGELLNKAAGQAVKLPPTAHQTAKVAAKFLMAYENGFIDKVAPSGFAPLLEKNSMTAAWLEDIRALQRAPVPSTSSSQPTSSQAAAPQTAPPSSAGPTAQPPAKLASTPPARVDPRPTVSSSPAVRTAGPGGISLSKAAAERLPLDLSIEAASVKDGRIVLSGRKDTQATIDAALFLTALRATCESRDPYFSLDPDDTAAWMQDTNKAGEELLAHIKNDRQGKLQSGVTRKTPSILKFRTISANASYPAYWSSLLSKYPNLRSKLVFSPEWLRQTRFGEILYKADVLLKELAGGAPVLGVASLRASSIDSYVPATQFTAAKRLLYKYHNVDDKVSTLAGGRIWYDLTETSSAPTTKPENPVPFNSELNTLLRKRDLLFNASDVSLVNFSPPQRDGMLDISQVYPRMYVRVRDPKTNRDAAGSFPGVDELAAKANASPQKYAAAYQEFQLLVEVFRAYVVAVHTKKLEPRLCASLPKQLLDAEKVSAALPMYHPTDLALTLGWYEYSDGRFRRGIGASGSLFQGGVSVGATRLFTVTEAKITDTPLLREMTIETAKVIPEPIWHNETNRRFISFAIDTDPKTAMPAPAPSAPQQATGNSTIRECPTREWDCVMAQSSDIMRHNEGVMNRNRLKMMTGGYVPLEQLLPLPTLPDLPIREVARVELALVAPSCDAKSYFTMRKTGRTRKQASEDCSPLPNFPACTAERYFTIRSAGKSQADAEKQCGKK